jgi:hypothetical protein
MNQIYTSSWALYKAHTESFDDDIEFYAQFINGYHALELFAGFGRVANRLLAKGHSIETVEILGEFANFINLPSTLNHVCSVLTYKPMQKFKRIYAAYNSFCLLTKDDEISLFFRNLSDWLEPGGLIALSYYHTNVWQDATGKESQFILDNQQITCIHDCDLSKRYSDNIGVWIDRYKHNDETKTFSYVTRVYETPKDLIPFAENAGLKLSDVVVDFNNPNISEPGWIDFIFEKAY